MKSYKSWTLSQKIIIPTTFTYAAFFIFMLVVRPGSEKFYCNFNNFYQAIAPLFGGVCGLVWFWRNRNGNIVQRIGWLLIAMSSLSWAGGQSAWTYLETFKGIEVPFPSIADIGYTGVYPFGIVGVLLLFGSMRVAGRARHLLDGAIAASSIGVLSWYFLVQKLWHASDVTPLGKYISVAYPLGDVAMLFGAIVLLSSPGSNKLFRKTLYLLAFGIVGITFFDITFTWMSLNGTYKTGSWSDWTMTFGWLAIGYAFLVRIWHQKQEQHYLDIADNTSDANQVSSWQIFTPYIAVAVALSIIGIHDFLQDRSISFSTVVAALSLMGLVVIRQVLTLVENRFLTDKLKTFNDNLENTVRDRTEQLTALHNLAKAVSTTMHPNEVLAAAVTHTKTALHSNAIIVWLIDEPKFGPSKTRIHSQEGFEHKPEMLAFLANQPMRQSLDKILLTTAPDADQCMGGICLRAPLFFEQRLTGMIGAVRWDGDFGITEYQLLESIGLEVGTALENARLYSAAVKAADIDSVTGLFNHRAVHQRLDQALHEAKKLGQHLSVIMLDIDNFKLFNDTYGHPTGDQVLRQVAKHLKEICHSNGILGRYGGDEFIVVLPNTTSDKALRVAQKIHDSVDAIGYKGTAKDNTVPLNISCGLASFPEDSSNRHELLTIADSSLYIAKETEKGVVVPTEEQRTNRQFQREDSFAMLDTLITAVDNKDKYTRRHSEDVTEYALWIAEGMHLSEETLRQVRISGLLHDVGKIGVPYEILKKPGRLSPEEYELIQRHPVIGAFIASAVLNTEDTIAAIRSHHERWDGHGYPSRLAGEDIPMIARILAVADTFSAMTTDRSYRKGMDLNVAVEEIRANRGTQFDPHVVDVFLHEIARRKPVLERDDTDLPLAA